MTGGLRHHRRWWFFAGTVVVGAVLVGTALAAPAQVFNGVAEKGGGGYVSESYPAYFVWLATQLWAMPTPVPASLSTTVSAPTVLPPAATSYTVGPATAGNLSVRWELQEGTTTPGSTELELRLVAGLSGPAVSLRVYLETQSTVPGAATNFLLYWDAGPFSPSTVTIETMQLTVLVCSSIGVCP